MLEFIGSWTNKTKVAGSPVEDFHFGVVRVARIMTETKNVLIKGERTTRKIYQFRIMLPGIGPEDFGFGYSMPDTKRMVEEVLQAWLADSGIQELFNGAGVAQEAAFVTPDAIVVLEGLKPAPASAKVIPLVPKSLPPRTPYADIKSMATKKPSHQNRRALSRGQ